MEDLFGDFSGGASPSGLVGACELEITLLVLAMTSAYVAPCAAGTETLRRGLPTIDFRAGVRIGDRPRVELVEVALNEHD